MRILVLVIDQFENALENEMHKPYRALICLMSFAAMTLSGAACGGTERSVSSGANLTCADFQSMLKSNLGLDSRVFSIQEIEIFNEKCELHDVPLSLVLRDFFIYRHAMNKRHPDSMSYEPNTDFGKLEAEANLRIDSLLKKFKNDDKKLIDEIMRFMVAQDNHVSGSPDIFYEEAALEIVARDFPSDYASYEALSKPSTDEREIWENVKESWLDEPKK